MAMLGHVNSSYYSPTLGRSIAMALVKGGHARKGQALYVTLQGRTLAVPVGDTTVFSAPEGGRRDGCGDNSSGTQPPGDRQKVSAGKGASVRRDQGGHGNM